MEYFGYVVLSYERAYTNASFQNLAVGVYVPVAAFKHMQAHAEIFHSLSSP